MARHVFTQEETAKAKTTRLQRDKQPFITFLDDGHWMQLARDKGVRLPSKTAPCSTGKMEFWFKKLGWTPTRYLKWVGGGKLSDFIEMNPCWGLRAFLGLLLEQGEER